MSSLYLDSEPILVVTRQLIYSSLDYIQKMNPDIDFQDVACMRRSIPQKTAKGMQEQNKEKSGDCKANVKAGKM